MHGAAGVRRAPGAEENVWLRNHVGAARAERGSGRAKNDKNVHSPQSPDTAPPPATSLPPRAPAALPGPCFHTAEQTAVSGSRAQGARSPDAPRGPRLWRRLLEHWPPQSISLSRASGGSQIEVTAVRCHRRLWVSGSLERLSL